MANLPPQYADAITFSFGDSPELNEELLGLVLAGKKTATCGALRDYEQSKEPMPVVGRRDVVLNGAGEPAAVIESLSIEIKRFDLVEPSFTDLEGEGPYAKWRAEHEAFFARNGGFSPEMELVCERFKLVEVLPAGRALYNQVASPIFIVTDIESDGPDAAAQFHAELCFGRDRGRRHAPWRVRGATDPAAGSDDQ
jgi:uncharacterized protein YhfF